MKKLLLMISLLIVLFIAVPHSLTVRARSFKTNLHTGMHTHATSNAGAYNFAPTSWEPVEIECPVCRTKNIFLQWVSYGSYVYQYPSKYQLVFWPYTEGAAWYSCKKCRLTLFMGSFAKIPKEKIPALQEMLKGVTLPAQKERPATQSMEEPPYLELPVSARMLVAEKVYRTLDVKDDDFWNHFYRLLGYHFEQEKKVAEADEARRKALGITERMLADKANEGTRKELLYLSGAMKHFLRNDAAALKDFEEAKKLSYSNKELKAEDNKGYDEYLSKLINDYITALTKGEKLPT